MEPRPLAEHVRPAYPTRREFLAAGAAVLAAAGIPGCRRDAEVSALVAPIFEHGDGRGAIGCIVVAPPVFLSEDEALQVVREALAEAGVTLGQRMPLPEVAVDYDPTLRGMRPSENWLGEPPAEPVLHATELAAVDRKQRVGVTIVTKDDCDRVDAGWYYGVGYDTKELAQNVAKAIRQQAKQDLCVGVFYDPLEEWGRKKARAQLRRQVQDFVAWMEKNR